MNRDELLTELAMGIKPWQFKGIEGYFCREYKGQRFQLWEYILRRQELINCPPDSDAPEWAEWKCQDADGLWKFTDRKPVFATDDNGRELNWWVAGVHDSRNFGEVPAGHDWRTTLTRINRDDNTSTPEEDEEFNRIQARQDANKPHEADARMLDAQLADAMGKQPRYLDATGEDWIDEFARTATLDEFRGAMRFTIGKYNRRVGRKDEILKEVRKMKDYCARWEAYELALAAKDRRK